MKVSPFAGKPVEPSRVVNVIKLIAAYYTESLDPSVPEQRVMFGTAGHRGSLGKERQPCSFLNRWGSENSISLGIWRENRQKVLHAAIRYGIGRIEL